MGVVVNHHYLWKSVWRDTDRNVRGWGNVINLIHVVFANFLAHRQTLSPDVIETGDQMKRTITLNNITETIFGNILDDLSTRLNKNIWQMSNCF